MVHARQAFDVVRERLALYLGPHTARNAIRTVLARDSRMRPEEITVHQALDLVPKFRPMLKVLVGATLCEQILAQLTVELELRT